MQVIILMGKKIEQDQESKDYVLHIIGLKDFSKEII